MSPEQISLAVTKIVGDVEIDLLQIEVGPQLAEVKARRAADREWFQGFVKVATLASRSQDDGSDER